MNSNQDQDQQKSNPFRASAVASLRPAKHPALAFAGLWLRAGAILIDTLVTLPFLIIPLVISGGTLDFIMDDSAEEFTPEAIYGVLSCLIYGICNFTYLVTMEASSYQGTLGKRLFRIHVVDDQGHRLTIARSVGRSLGRFVSNYIPFGLGYLIVIFTSKKQTVHDIISSTLVVKD